MMDRSACSENAVGARQKGMCDDADKGFSPQDVDSFSDACCIEDILPDALWRQIFSHLVDARDLARAALVNWFFRKLCSCAERIQFRCKLENLSRIACEGAEGRRVTPFKETVTRFLKNFEFIKTLELEIMDDVQAMRFEADGVVDKTSLWLSEGRFVRGWLPPVGQKLVNLTLIDYGRQAILQPSPLLPLLSQHCKQLQKLEVRNLYLDSDPTSCEPMTNLTQLRLKRVQLMDNGLEELGKIMPRLQLLVLESVVGLAEAKLKSEHLRVMCLACVTNVSAVTLESSSLRALQLKMHCPNEIRIHAPALQTLTLKITRRPNDVIEFHGVRRLKELLVGNTEVALMQKLCRQNSGLERVYLDIPCMKYDGLGSWKGQKDNLPPFSEIWRSLTSSLQGIRTLSAGPGLWFCMEESIQTDVLAIRESTCLESDEKDHSELVRTAVRARLPGKWPNMKHLTLHAVARDACLSFEMISHVVQAMPSLKILEIYFHKNSKVSMPHFSQSLKEFYPKVTVSTNRWCKDLNFSSFSAPETFM